jgi:iron complex transport system substrate-binding protein
MGDRVIGLDDFSDWPSEWSYLPRLGPDLDIDIEKVKLLNPDLVIASLSVPGMEKNIERLKEEKIPYIVLNPKSLHEIPNDIMKLGQALFVVDKAENLANRFRCELEQIQSHIPASSLPVRLYFEWWPKPVFSPGNKNWLTDISHLIGASQIFEEYDQESVQSDWETVADKNPDYCLIVWTGIPKHRIRKELITSRPAFQGQKWIEPGRLHILEEGWYCRPSPRILTGIKYLAHILYPERFISPNPNDPFHDTRQ